MQQTKREHAARRRVWGIGLTRTGTTSLNRALRMLGYHSIHWPTTAMLLYGDIEAATDESVAVVFEYLDCRYPGSKFILTHREEAAWLTSTARHRDQHAARHRELLRTPPDRLDAGRRDRWVEIMFTQMSLYGSVEFSADRFRAGYNRHHQRVREHFALRPEALLSLNICAGEGWDKLCPFLEEMPPPERFPHANTGTVETS